jgi:IS5 family transposase
MADFPAEWADVLEALTRVKLASNTAAEAQAEYLRETAARNAAAMRPRERREGGEQDLFRSRLDQVINMDHALVKLARTIDWRFLEEKFGAMYADGSGRPPLPTRLMAGLAILKHTYNLSDEVVCELWIENPYYQYFCGEEFFQHRLPLDRSSMTNWRHRMGEERLQALLQESLAVATRTGAMKPGDLARVIVDTTVQPKNISFPNRGQAIEPGA